jgi:hypothetical protein
MNIIFFANRTNFIIQTGKKGLVNIIKGFMVGIPWKDLELSDGNIELFRHTPERCWADDPDNDHRQRNSHDSCRLPHGVDMTANIDISAREDIIKPDPRSRFSFCCA